MSFTSQLEEAKYCIGIMKILHMVNTYAEIGGIETYVIKLLPLLTSRGHENMVIYREEHPRTPAVAGQKIFHVPITADNANDNRQIAALIERERPDVIYLHDTHDPALVMMVSQMVPTAGYVHIFYPVCPGLGKLHRRTDTVCERAFGLGCVSHIYIDRCASAKRPSNVLNIMRQTQQHVRALHQLPRVIVASAYMRDLMIQNGIDANKVDVLPPHFIATRGFATPPQHNHSNTNIMFAGRLEYEKGVPYLLRAVQQLRGSFTLTVAGSGSRQAEYVRLAHKLGIANSVQFKHWIPSAELDSYYRNSAVTVMPTIMPEPFGKVGVEAMANGCPVVAFNVGGIPDWLKDAHNGYLVPPKDSRQLAHKIQRLLDDAPLSNELGSNGRRFVEENYSANKHIEALIRMLQKTVAQCS